MSELLLCQERASLPKLSASTTGSLCKHSSEYFFSPRPSTHVQPALTTSRDSSTQGTSLPPLKTRFHQGKHLFIALRAHKPPLTSMPIHPTNHRYLLTQQATTFTTVNHQVLAVVVRHHSHSHHLPPWQTRHSTGENMKLHTS